MTATPSPQPLAAPVLIAEIIWLLCQTIAERVPSGLVTRAAAEYIVKRLLGIRQRFRRVVARIQAGKFPRERVRKPRKRRDPEVVQLESELPRGRRRMRDKDSERKPEPLWRALGQTSGWLVRLAPQIPNFVWSAPACRARLEMALDDPEMQALLRTSRAVGDALRPLCWMLLIDVSRLSPRPPPAVQSAAAVAEHVVSETACEAAEVLGEETCQNAVAGLPRAASADDEASGPGLDPQTSPEFSTSA